jgi:hypothetical protein
MRVLLSLVEAIGLVLAVFGGTLVVCLVDTCCTDVRVSGHDDGGIYLVTRRLMV